MSPSRRQIVISGNIENGRISEAEPSTAKLSNYFSPSPNKMLAKFRINGSPLKIPEATPAPLFITGRQVQEPAPAPVVVP